MRVFDIFLSIPPDEVAVDPYLAGLDDLGIPADRVRLTRGGRMTVRIRVPERDGDRVAEDIAEEILGMFPDMNFLDLKEHSRSSRA